MFLEGIVIPGRRIGHKLGFPTANIAVSDSVNIADGVYSSRAEVAGVWYDAVSNLGYKPSVGGGECRLLETHILNFDGDLYGCILRVELLDWLRAEQHFDTLEELRAQISKDIENVKGLILR